MSIITSRERVIRALTHQPADRVPRDLWTAPGFRALRSDELRELRLRFPSDVQRPTAVYPPGLRSEGKPHRVGEYTDAWGCIWEVTERGTAGQVKYAPLADRSQLASYEPPFELLSGMRISDVNRAANSSTRFVLGWSETRPFERLQFLRGTETARGELLRGNREIRGLLTNLHNFFLRDITRWTQSDVDGVLFGDVWASSQQLFLPLEVWRDLFRPLYRDYCELLHEHDKFVLFRSGGDISAILPDLIEMGVDAVHCPLAGMDLERLRREYRGRITFWGEIVPHETLHHGAPADVRQAVRRVRRNLDAREGGLVAQCAWNPKVPLANLIAFFDEWLYPLSNPSSAAAG